MCLSLTFILSVPTTIGCFSGKEDFLLEAFYLHLYVVYTVCTYLGGLCRPLCACVLVSKKKEELSDFVMKVLTTNRIFFYLLNLCCSGHLPDLWYIFTNDRFDFELLFSEYRRLTEGFTSGKIKV